MQNLIICEVYGLLNSLTDSCNIWDYTDVEECIPHHGGEHLLSYVELFADLSIITFFVDAPPC